MATTIDNLRNEIRRLRIEAAAKDSGLDPDFLEPVVREFGDNLSVRDDGSVEIAGYSSVGEFLGERVKTDRPKFFTPAKKVEALGYTAAELAAMNPSEKMREATLANKPKGY